MADVKLNRQARRALARQIVTRKHPETGKRATGREVQVARQMVAAGLLSRQTAAELEADAPQVRRVDDDVAQTETGLIVPAHVAEGR